MKRCHYIIFTVAIAFFLTACSTDNDLATAPNLNSQFGTADEDVGLDVAFSATGRIYTLARQSGELEYGTYESLRLRRFDNTGKLVFNEQIYWDGCSYRAYECLEVTPHALKTNTQGYVYALISHSGVEGDCVYIQSTFVLKHDASGNLISDTDLGRTGWEMGADDWGNRKASMAVDGSGNLYAALEQSDVDASNCVVSNVIHTVTKRSPSGSLLWQRTASVGELYGITVSSTGNVYVVGSRGMARYSNTGNLVWTKTGTSYSGSELTEVVASGTNVYVSVPQTKTIRKYDANGKLLWSKVQSGLNTLVVGDISADANGNVYISGKYRPTSSSPANAFVRKLRPTGAILWTKTFGTPQYDDTRSIATINGSEIYVTGETQGSLAHTNIGGSDGYLRKLNSLGNQVWVR